MTPEQFCYWLQGFVEMTQPTGNAAPSQLQWKIIMDHLNTVFKKVTPDYAPKALQKLLTEQQPLKREALDPFERYCSNIDKEIC